MDFLKPVPLEQFIPTLIEIEKGVGDDVGMDKAALLAWLEEEIGSEYAQIYLAGAWVHSTDLRPYKAIQRLMDLSESLKDENRLLALNAVLNQEIRADMPPSPEQFGLITQKLYDIAPENTENGASYASVRMWLDSLTEYAMLLNEQLNVPATEAVKIAMQNYGDGVNGIFAKVYVESKLAQDLNAIQ